MNPADAAVMREHERICPDFASFHSTRMNSFKFKSLTAMVAAMAENARRWMNIATSYRLK